MNRRRVVWPVVLLGVLAALPALALLVVRVVPELQVVSVLGWTRALALVSSFIGYGVIGWVVDSGCLLIATLRARRRRVLALVTAVAVAGLGLQLSWIAPSFVADRRAPTGPSFTVMSLNMYMGAADPRKVAERAQQADIVVLLEITPAAAGSLRAVGLDDRFPYRVGDGREGISGSAVYSRYPIRALTELRTSYQQWVTVVDVPEVGPVTVIAAHPCNPFCGAAKWQRESEQVREQAVLHMDGPTVVAGDFNAVDDHLPMPSSYVTPGTPAPATWPGRVWSPPTRRTGRCRR